MSCFHEKILFKKLNCYVKNKTYKTVYKLQFPSNKVIGGLYFEEENNPYYLITAPYTYKGQTLEGCFSVVLVIQPKSCAC